MATPSPECQEKYPAFDRWLGYVFSPLVHGDVRVLSAFWKWSSFKDTAENRSHFSYGMPPTLEPLDSLIMNTCEYHNDGSLWRVRYGATFSAAKIGINSKLLDLFEEAIVKPLPYSDDTHLLIEAVEGTILHEMVHWSYFKTGDDEKKKWHGHPDPEEYGTTHFELEAFGHPITGLNNRLCESHKDFPYLGTSTDSITETTDQGSRTVLRVKEVTPGSPAAIWGIRVGDVIRKFDGEDIYQLPNTFAEQLQHAKKPGDSVILEVYRPSTKTTTNMQITLGAWAVGK